MLGTAVAVQLLVVEGVVPPLPRKMDAAAAAAAGVGVGVGGVGVGVSHQPLTGRQWAAVVAMALMEFESS